MIFVGLRLRNFLLFSTLFVILFSIWVIQILFTHVDMMRNPAGRTTLRYLARIQIETL